MLQIATELISETRYLISAPVVYERGDFTRNKHGGFLRASRSARIRSSSFPAHASNSPFPFPA